MRHSITQPLERHSDLQGPYATEPYECAWAGEALFFVRAQEVAGDRPRLTGRVQVSPDGINWCDEGTALEPLTSEGMVFVRVSHFGGWLRLAGEVSGEGARFNVVISLVLKE